MTAIDEQNFINACNTLDGDDFFIEANLYLKKVDSSAKLNEFIEVLGKVCKFKNIEASHELYSVCYLLRDKTYELLLAKGDVPEQNVIYLYALFRLCTLTEDSRFVGYGRFVEQNLYSEGITDTERVFLIVLGFFAAMANSRSDAYEKFLGASMKLNYMEISHIGFSNLVTNFINHIDIDINETFEVLKKVWEKESYFALDKTVRRSVFNWSLHSLWGVEKYFNHPLWTFFYPLWKDIFYEHIKRDECDEAMYVHFFIYHKMGNSFQTQEEWKMFNDEIDIPASRYYKDWCEKAGLDKCKTEQSGDKKVMGFLWDRFVENSPFKVAYSLWKTLTSNKAFIDKFDIKIYSMGYFEKSNNDPECVDAVRKLGIELFDGAEPFYINGVYHSHLEKALYVRQKIINDGVDVLIHGSSYDINDFLVAGRCAPKQIFWSHGNATYHIDDVDKTISHCNLSAHTEYQHFAALTDLAFLNPFVEPYVIAAARNRYPKDVVILGTIGRLVKVENDEYLDAIAKIMRRHSNAIYIAAGGGNIDNLRNKVEKLGISDRFYMPGFVDPHIYGAIIDIWPNTFPLEQGLSTEEFRAKGRPTIFLNNSSNVEQVLKDTEEMYDLYVKEDLITKEDIDKKAYYKGLNLVEYEVGFGVADYVQKIGEVVADRELAKRLGEYEKFFWVELARAFHGKQAVEFFSGL